MVMGLVISALVFVGCATADDPTDTPEPDDGSTVTTTLDHLTTTTESETTTTEAGTTTTDQETTTTASN